MFAPIRTATSLSVLALLPSTFAQQPTSTPMNQEPRTRVVSAALFKNGYAFVRREGKIGPGSSELVIEALPSPTHGTFWISADPNEVSIERAVARRGELQERVPARTLPELLRANVGQSLTLHLAENESISGTLLEVAQPQSTWMVEDTSGFPAPLTAGADMLLVGLDEGTTAIPTSAVRRVTGKDLSNELERPRATASLTISATVEGNGEASLNLSYLERGLTWVPSYAIDVSQDGVARLTAKAEIINEAEDIVGARIELVTGFPNLGFSHIVDPIAMRGDMDTFLRELGSSTLPEAAVATQRMRVSAAAPSGGGSAHFPTAGAPAGGTAVGDLFFYELEDVALGRGERGMYPLFTVEAPYYHVYEWTIEDTIHQRGGPSRAEEEIWHSLRLTNDSEVPWTTAPAMTMEDGRLLGQDTLEYTAAGAETTLRITRAADVIGEQVEYEASRNRNAANILGRAYDQVVVRGELRITNHKAEPVRLEITKLLQGEVLQNPDEAEVASLAERLQEVNPRRRLTWKPTLPPGETSTISYHYQLYSRP